MDDELLKKIENHFVMSGKILTENEISAIRRIIYNMDKMYVFNEEEVKNLKDILDKYTYDEDYREVQKFILDEFRTRENKDIMRKMLTHYRFVVNLGKFFVWLRNVSILVTSLIIVWINFSDNIKAFFRGLS